MTLLAVIVCSHNPRKDYFHRMMESLRSQSLASDRWELLVVDNASQCRLADVWDLSWHPNGRHVQAPKLGLSNARLRGIAESSSELLVFVDDDNVLDANYLSGALRIAAEWPRLGVWGSGAIVPEFESPPAEYLRNLTGYLALREVPKPLWSNVMFCKEATPWGAGLCVRANVANAYATMHSEAAIAISGRRGSQQLSGEDVEISYVACHLGLGRGIFPELKITHLMPQERVSRSHLLKVFEGTKTSDALLAYKWGRHLPKSPLRPWGLLSIFKNLLLRRGLDRELYLANERAIISALRIIKSGQRNGPTFDPTSQVS